MSYSCNNPSGIISWNDPSNRSFTKAIISSYTSNYCNNVSDISIIIIRDNKRLRCRMSQLDSMPVVFWTEVSLDGFSMQTWCVWISDKFWKGEVFLLSTTTLPYCFVGVILYHLITWIKHKKKKNWYILKRCVDINTVIGLYRVHFWCNFLFYYSIVTWQQNTLLHVS